jgi:hypothetical protein
MELTRVTFTGADDSVPPARLAEISADYPWVEWGILFSGKWQGTPRYPTPRWLQALHGAFDRPTVRPQAAAHLCGNWVRNLVELADIGWFGQYGEIVSVFGRVQLNFHGQFHRQHHNFRKALAVLRPQMILQCDGVNDGAAEDLAGQRGLNCVPLFDTLPATWPDAWLGVYCGYAGGLGPDNVVDQLHRIEDASQGQPFWIDMERRVRTDDDQVFDLGRVLKVIEAVAPFVQQHVAPIEGVQS